MDISTILSLYVAKTTGEESKERIYLWESKQTSSVEDAFRIQTKIKSFPFAQSPVQKASDKRITQTELIAR